MPDRYSDVPDATRRISAVLADSRAALWCRAPGRVNLIGEHTDYNEGYVLPMTIDRACVVAARPADAIRLTSLDLGGTVELRSGGEDDIASVSPPWGGLAAAVVDELSGLGRPPVGVDAVLASDIPIGAGLSSSAAFEVAFALTLAETADWRVDPRMLAVACRNAEERATGVPCGVMDQLVVLTGEKESATLIDCRTLEVTPVPLPAELAVLVVHSGRERRLAASGYAERRRACERLARRLGVAALRDATLAQVGDDPLGRHVVSENERVLRAVDALEQGDLETLGWLMCESHASLRDDFRVSTSELDALAEALVQAGAFGARLTGGGFGGAVVAVCDEAAADAISRTAVARYRGLTGLRPRVFRCRAVEGAGAMYPPV